MVGADIGPKICPNTQVSTAAQLLFAQRLLILQLRSQTGFWVVGPIIAHYMFSDSNRVILINIIDVLIMQ